MSKIETTESRPASWRDIEWLLSRSGSESLIPERVRAWREERKPKSWSQTALAIALTAAEAEKGREPWSKAMVVRLEGGDKKLTTTEALTVAGVFGKSLADLLLPHPLAPDLEGLRLFDEATRRLEAVREAMDAYVDAVEKARVRAATSPALTDFIERRKHQSADAARVAWRGENKTIEALRGRTRGPQYGGLPNEPQDFDQWLTDREPPPVEVVALHASSATRLSADRWWSPQTWSHDHAVSGSRARAETSSALLPRATKGQPTSGTN